MNKLIALIIAPIFIVKDLIERVSTNYNKVVNIVDHIDDNEELIAMSIISQVNIALSSSIDSLNKMKLTEEELKTAVEEHEQMIKTWSDKDIVPSKDMPPLFHKHFIDLADIVYDLRLVDLSFPVAFQVSGTIQQTYQAYKNKYLAAYFEKIQKKHSPLIFGYTHLEGIA